MEKMVVFDWLACAYLLFSGILLAIFDRIKPIDKYFVEFGVETAIECNTRALRELHGWSGLMLDSHHHNTDIHRRSGC